VVTITGTAGWEAPIRGKPSIIFGPSTWYRGCPGVYYIQAHEQLQRVINRIKSGETVSKKDIKSFVKVVQEVGYRGYIASGHKNKQVDATTNIENLTEAAIVQQRQF
jgi:hypothetical protein